MTKEDIRQISLFPPVSIVETRTVMSEYWRKRTRLRLPKVILLLQCPVEFELRNLLPQLSYRLFVSQGYVSLHEGDPYP